ncbi:MAG: hypothetical protein ACR2P0_20310 [Acidimicrobiales bacterium]
MTTQAHTHFDVLLHAWREHQSLRVSGASIAELTASRDRLDEARLRARGIV